MSQNNGAEAELNLQYSNEATAQAIIEAIQPDNYHVPEGLILCITRRKTMITVIVRCPKGIGSLISTIDDLLSCFAAAEKALRSLNQQLRSQRKV